MNGTTAQKKLLDLRGNATAATENGVKQSTADQIGYVLTLNGSDQFIELKNIKDQCVVDPSLCREGLSVAFWLKHNRGEIFSEIVIVIVIFIGQFCPRGKGVMRLTSCKATRPDHSTRELRVLLFSINVWVL